MNNELEKTEQSVIKADNTISKSQSTTLTIGMVLDGKYEIKREIARGGMGIIYEAYHNFFKKRVAIKIILSDEIKSSQLRRFQKEVLAYVNLSHPNIIKIYDTGIYKNKPYIAMEYIDGVNICEYVAQHDKNYTKPKGYNSELGIKRDWKLCAKLIYKTALALAYIHKQNMFHRDIKPSNIIVRSDGTPVIIDLGLVKIQSGNSASLTLTGELLGTIQYMPIEQAQGKQGKIDARSDIYSLGLVLYELLTGEMAYSGTNILEISYKIMSYYPPLPREINPQIPKALEEITIHATEKKKEKRYATAQEFADALKKYLYDKNSQPPSKSENALKKYLYDKNSQPPSKSENALKKYLYDKKQVRLQWNKKRIIKCFIALELVVLLVLIIVIISMIFSNFSTSTDEKTKPIPKPPSESTRPTQKPEETTDPSTSGNQVRPNPPTNPKQETDLEKRNKQLQKERELETELDEIKKQYDNFTTQAWNSLRNEIENRESKLKEYEDLKEKQTNLERKIEKKQLEIDNTQKEYQELKDTLNTKEDQGLKDTLNALEELKNKTTDQRVQSYINNIKSTIKSVDDIVDIIISLEEELISLKKELSDNDRARLSFSYDILCNIDYIERLKIEKKDLEEKLKKSKDRMRYAPKIENKDKEIEQLKKQNKEIGNKISELQSDFNKIKNIQKIINIGQRKFDSIQEELKSINQEIMILSTQCKEREKEKCILEQDLDNLKSLLLLKQEQYDSLPKEIDEKKKQLEDEMKKFETNYENCQKDSQKKSLTEKETEIQQLQKQLDELKQLQNK